MVAFTEDAVAGTVTPHRSVTEVLLDCRRFTAPVIRTTLGAAARHRRDDHRNVRDRNHGHGGEHGKHHQQPADNFQEELSGNRKGRMGRISLDDLFKQANRLSQLHKPHKANDAGWEAVERVRARDGDLGLHHFKLLKRLGCGDIGSVYLAELRHTKFRFAMKVMDLGTLASRRKQIRVEMELEILAILDHPFLPTLYTHFETPQFLCLVMEYCAGGDLHTLRQKQEGKCFSIKAARFYAAEVLLALEYLHMMGVVYRDLKPENVLVRGDGHVIVSDFDLSLKCSVSPMLLTTHSNSSSGQLSSSYNVRNNAEDPDPSPLKLSCGLHPVSCLPRSIRGGLEYVISINSGGGTSRQTTSRFAASKPPSSRWRPRLHKSASTSCNADQLASLPELVAEPTGVRSMSFVGTHEYLAPEIISGEGHGSPVDWWMFGIFLFELLYGKTPFKGEENEITLVNILAKPLEFPAKEDPAYREIDSSAEELIKALLVKDPGKRFGFNRGATEVKQHPFFEGINWALIRCTSPPQIPRVPGQLPNTKQKQEIDWGAQNTPPGVQGTPPSSKKHQASPALAAESTPAATPDHDQYSTPCATPPRPSPPPSDLNHRRVHSSRAPAHRQKNYDMLGDSKERSVGRLEYF